MEQSEKKSLKISIFDIVIVALCLVAAAVVFMMLKPKNVTVGTPSGTPMRYTVEVQKMPAGAGELVQPGDAKKLRHRHRGVLYRDPLHLSGDQ